MLIFELLFTYCVGKVSAEQTPWCGDETFYDTGQSHQLINGRLVCACVCVCVALAMLKAQEGCFLVGMGTETKYTSVRERQLWQELKRRPETLPSCLIYKKKQIEHAEKNVHGRA